MELHDHTQSPSTRNNGRLVNRIGGSHIHCNDGVASLVIGRQLLLFLRHGTGTAFRAHHDLVLGILEFGHGHEPLVATRCHQG